jgi:hypothetical protein
MIPLYIGAQTKRATSLGEVARRGAWGTVQSLWACLIVWNPPSAESGTLPSVIRTERLYSLSEFLLPSLVR